MSPLGAVRMRRGSRKPCAYISTLKPLGAIGHAPSGRGTTLGAVVDRLVRLRLGQIGESDLAAHAGMLLGVVREGGLAGDDVVPIARRGR